jgi:hypothetical protein
METKEVDFSQTRGEGYFLRGDFSEQEIQLGRERP